MMSPVFFLFAFALVDGQAWPAGTGGQPQPNSAGIGQSGFSNGQFQNPQGSQFGQGQPQPGFGGSNPQFGNPSLGSQPQQPVAPQNIGQIPPNNPPPGTVTGADRATMSGGGSNPQWANSNQPNWQAGWQGQQGQPNQQQPGQPNWQGGNPTWNGQGSNQPGNPQNPNQPLWQQQSSTPSTPYPAVQGRPPWAAAANSRPLYSLVCLTVFLGLVRILA